MQRDTYNTVTGFPVLIPCEAREQQGLATFLGREEFQPVRAFSDGDLVPGSKKHPLRTMLESEQEFFGAILALSRGLEKKDSLAVTRARQMLIKAIARKEKRSPDSELLNAVASMRGIRAEQIELVALELCTLRAGEQDERWLLSSRISEALASVRLVLWWSGAQFRPALFCPDLQSALYTYVLMKTYAKQGWGVCPFCGIFFVQGRSDQNYCSVAHREAHRVARWRAGKVSKSKKKGGKRNVTHKAR